MTWYVRPMNSDALLAVSVQLKSEKCTTLPAFGIETGIEVWRCSFKEFNAFRKANKEEGLAVEFFKQRGDEPIKRCSFPKRLKVARYL